TWGDARSSRGSNQYRRRSAQAHTAEVGRFHARVGADSNEIHPANRAPSDPHSVGRTLWAMSRAASVGGPSEGEAVGSQAISQHSYSLLPPGRVYAHCTAPGSVLD